MAFDLGFFGGSDTFGGRSAPGVGQGLFSAEGSFGGGGQDTGLFPQGQGGGGLRPGGRRFFRNLTPPEQTPRRPDEVREETLGSFARLMFLLSLRIQENMGIDFGPPDLGAEEKEQIPFKGVPIPDFSEFFDLKSRPRTPTSIPGPTEKFERKPRQIRQERTLF